MRQILVLIAVFIVGGCAGFWLGARRASFAVAPISPKTATLEMSLVDGGQYRVRKVIDGDSLILENGIRVCYFGVRAPESGHYVKDAAPLAAESTQRNAELVEGKLVRLSLAKNPFDIHGRVLARVFLPPAEAGVAETEVGNLLVHEGLGRAFGLGLAAEDYRALKAIEETAKAEKAGIWGLEDKLRKAAKSGKPYCASGSSGLYHLASCSTALRIRPENRHEYGSIEEAEEAGKNPCRRCVPR
jgi:micrococcal nuclease